ncbi:MAG: type IV secretion system DNA-binding domain-containing protein [Candidatus Jacksonbacteria bacterium]
MIIRFDFSFWHNLITHPAELARYLFTIGGILLCLFLILGVFIRFWLNWRRKKYRQKVKFVTLTIDIPPDEIKTPKAIENIISQLYAIKSRFFLRDKWWKGQYVLQTSMEIIGQDGYVQFALYVPEKYRTLLEKAIYAQYPEAQITEVKDYTADIEVKDLITENKEALPDQVYDIWGTEFVLDKPPYYPIRTYPLFTDASGEEFADPLAAILEIMSHLKRGERFWYQIVITPTRKNWQEAGNKAIQNIVAGKSEKNRWFVYGLYGPILKLISSGLTAFSEGLLGSSKEEKHKTISSDFLTMVPPEQDLVVKAIREKASRLGFSVFVRAIYIAPASIFDPRHVTGDFQGMMRQFANPQMNSFGSDIKIEVDYPPYLFPKLRAKYRKRWFLKRVKTRYSGTGPDKPNRWNRLLKLTEVKNILSVEEVATLWHFPMLELSEKSGLIKKVLSKKVHPKQLLPQDSGSGDNVFDPDITFFAQTNFRGLNQRFGIKREDRRRHMYLIGKTGMGKTTMLENMIYQDIMRGEGVAVIDPHGDLVENIIDLIPSERINDVVYFNPADQEHPIGFNILSQEGVEHRFLIASSLVGIFKKIWADSWGPRLEYLLRNSLLTLLETEENTILGVPRIFVDTSYRKKLIRQVGDPVVKSFWLNEYSKYNQNFQVEAISPIQNKIGQFISIPLIRNMIGQVKSKINFREILDKKKIFLVNLSKGLIGEDVSALLGATIISKLQIAAMMRADKPEIEREDFYLYIDEFQNFSTESFAAILSEARKYRLNLIMAHQYIEQLDELVAAAVFGNVGSSISFGIGAEDAQVLELQFSPEFLAQDLVNLGKYEVVLRLMINGATSRSFSAETLAPLGAREVSSRDKIIKVSRERYSVPRKEIEEKLVRWLEPA